MVQLKIGGMALKKLVKLSMIKITSILVLIIFMNVIMSCDNCNNKMYFYKDYLYPNLELKLEINDKIMYDKINKDFVIPNPYKIKKYCNDICLDKLNSSIIKVRYTVNKRDTLLYLDSKKIKGVYLGYERNGDKMNVIVDSIGKGLFWDGLPTGFD